MPSAPDERSLFADRDPSPGFISLRSISPPSPTRGEGAPRAWTESHSLLRRLPFDRVDLERAQAAEAQHVHRQGAVDAVAVEHADQIVDAVDLDAVEPDRDVAGQQPRLRRRAVRPDLRQQRAHLVLDTGEHGMPPRHWRGLPGDADIGAADIAVADDLRQYELRGVAGDRKADALRAVDDGGVDADHLGRR